MNSIQTTSKLFYLITTADGAINEKEVSMAERFIKAESLDKEDFYREIKILESYPAQKVYETFLNELRNLNQPLQTHYIAWMALIANADGFMEKNEWKLIYTLYHKELKLDLQDIMNIQRDLVHQVNKV